MPWTGVASGDGGVGGAVDPPEPTPVPPSGVEDADGKSEGGERHHYLREEATNV